MMHHLPTLEEGDGEGKIRIGIGMELVVFIRILL
jgi:hypothetical protein